MPNDPWLSVGVGLAWFGLTGLAMLWLFQLVQTWRRRRRQRPNWSAMLADTDYFHGALVRIFHGRGYRVDRSWVIKDKIERQDRELVLALSRQGVPHAALCGRWVIPITSEVITRFEQALAKTQAQQGWVVTTSYFTPAAIAQGEAYAVELVDGAVLQKWIEELW